MVIFLKTDRDSEAIVRYCWYVIPAIASEYPSEYIHHTKEAGSRLWLAIEILVTCHCHTSLFKDSHAHLKIMEAASAKYLVLFSCDPFCHVGFKVRR